MRGSIQARHHTGNDCGSTVATPPFQRAQRSRAASCHVVKSNPKPAQKPHPPVLLGGGAKNVLQRAVAWGDGWLPNRVTPDQLRESRATLDRLAKDAGRDPSAITITVHGQPADRDLIRRLHDAGANRVLVRPPAVKTIAEMGTELTKIADAVLR